MLLQCHYGHGWLPAGLDHKLSLQTETRSSRKTRNRLRPDQDQHPEQQHHVGRNSSCNDLQSEAKEVAKTEVTQWEQGPGRSLITGDKHTHRHALLKPQCETLMPLSR